MSDELRASLGSLSLWDLALLEWRTRWLKMARPKQVIDFTKETLDTIFIHAGRGFGKSLTLGQWISWELCNHPKSFGHIIAPTHNDVRYVNFEGESGICRHVPGCLIKYYNKTDSIMEFYNGSVLRGFSAEESERLRGPQCFPAETRVTMADGSQVPIVNVNVGDLVATHHGPRKVLASRLTRENAWLWRLESSQGHELLATMDHKIYSACEFIEIWKLKPGNPLLSFSEAKHTTGRLPDIGNGPNALGRDGKVNGYALISTEMSTQPTSAPYHRGTTFITKTITGITTRPITLKLCPWQNTAPITLQDIPGEMEELGYAASGKIVNPLKQYASNAGQPFSQEAPGKSGDSAIVGAKQDGNGATVKSVNRVSERADVYDIEVEEAHAFFANGLLVHNCHYLACDEIAAWIDDRAALEQAKFGHRLGKRTTCVITSTPKPKELIKEIFADKTIKKIGGHMEENRANLSDNFIKQMNILKGTRLGRQELAGELLDAEEMGIIKRSQWKKWPISEPLPDFDIILMSLDTALSEEAVDVKKDPQGKKTDFTACSVWGAWREPLSRDEREAIDARRDLTHQEIQKAKAGQPRILLLDAWQDRLGFPELVSRVKKEKEQRWGLDAMVPEITPIIGSRRMFNQGRKPDIILIEDKNSGISLRQQLRREGVPVMPYNPGKADKLMRLNLVAPLFVAGYVYAPLSSIRTCGACNFQWQASRKVETLFCRQCGQEQSASDRAHQATNFHTSAEPLIGQMCAYAGEYSIEHDDLMDSATQALLWLSRNWLQLPVYQENYAGKIHTPKGLNPYAV